MNKEAIVYFLKLEEIVKIKDLLPEFKGELGLKCHFGEEGNDAYVPARHIKKIASFFGYPNLLETTVLYRSPRSQASTHKEVAKKHGFDFAPIDILDGEEGDDYLETELEGHNADTNLKKFHLGKNIENYDSLLVVSHFKGHMASGFGGAIKNLSMGLASRRGKLDMHAGVKHQVTESECISCGVCIASCPVNAIDFNENTKAFIDQKACIGCSKCIAVCPVSAIKIPFGTVNKEDFQGRLAEYAMAAAQGRQCFYINFLINIVPLCDCMGQSQEKLTDDIGILVSSDPVAIDQASYDLVVKQFPGFKEYSGENQLIHGEKIGLGTRAYQLKKV